MTTNTYIRDALAGKYGSGFQGIAQRLQEKNNTPTGQVAGASTNRLPPSATDMGVLTDEQVQSIGLPSTGFESSIPKTSSGGTAQNLRQAMAGVTMATTPASRTAVGGKTPNSAGSYYGSAGTNSLGTDIAGNNIMGTLGGRNVIGGRVAVDRTQGIPQDPMAQYMQMLSPQSVQQRQQPTYDQWAKERRSQLDAIRDKYKAQVNEEQAQGQQDLARQRSMNLRAGLGGSDFGIANKIGVREGTQKNIQAIQANEEIAIGEAIDNIERLAQTRFVNEQNALNQGFQNMFKAQEYQQAQKQEAISRIAELGKSGLDLPMIKERDPDLYNSLTLASGMGDVELEAVLNNNKLAQSRVDYQWEVIGGKIIGYGVDPVTGQLKKLEQEVDIPDNYEIISTMPDGTVLAAPDNWDGDTSKIKTVGNYAKPVSSSGSGLTPYQTFQATQNLKKNTQTMTAASRELQRQVGNMETAWNRLQSGEAEDLNATSQAIITTFNKILDPTSVVRESEYDRTPGGQALVSQIEGKINAITQGGPGLTEQSLKELVDLGVAFAQGAQSNIDAKTASAREEAQFFGLNPDFVVGTAGTNVSEIEVLSPDGTIGTIPANQLEEALEEGYTQV